MKIIDDQTVVKTRLYVLWGMLVFVAGAAVYITTLVGGIKNSIDNLAANSVDQRQFQRWIDNFRDVNAGHLPLTVPGLPDKDPPDKHPGSRSDSPQRMVAVKNEDP